MMAYINRTYPPAPFLRGKGSKALLMALSEWIAPWKPKPPRAQSLANPLAIPPSS